MDIRANGDSQSKAMAKPGPSVTSACRRAPSSAACTLPARCTLLHRCCTTRATPAGSPRWGTVLVSSPASSLCHHWRATDQTGALLTARAHRSSAHQGRDRKVSVGQGPRGGPLRHQRTSSPPTARDRCCRSCVDAARPARQLAPQLGRPAGSRADHHGQPKLVGAHSSRCNLRNARCFGDQILIPFFTSWTVTARAPPAEPARAKARPA